MLESLPPSSVGQKLGDRARPESRILERWTSFVRGGDVEPRRERMCAVGEEDICYTWLWGHETLACEGMFPRQAAQKSSLSFFLQLPALTSPLPQQPQQRKLFLSPLGQQCRFQNSGPYPHLHVLDAEAWLALTVLS